MTAGQVPLILVVGAESTGKTTLARALAEEVGGVYVPEMLRMWVELHGSPPTRSEQRELFDGQVGAEDLAQRALGDKGTPAVLDCGPFMTAVYSQMYYDDLTLEQLAADRHGRYLATLWCDKDIPWVPDPGQRDGPDARDAGHACIERFLERYPAVGAATTLISGCLEERVRSARAVLARAGLPSLSGMAGMAGMAEADGVEAI